MKKEYHMSITIQALEPFFSDQALKTIIAANLHQDRLAGQIGHPEYHFDDSSFAEGNAYILNQRQLILKSLLENASLSAWQAFGRLLHAAQDFYAHSTYVRLWYKYQLSQHREPKPEGIEPLEHVHLHHPELISGRIYLPWEILSFIPLFAPLMRRLLPADSHANLNLDNPARGPLFEYALVAARKRSLHEYYFIIQEFQALKNPLLLPSFTGLDNPVN